MSCLHDVLGRTAGFSHASRSARTIASSLGHDEAAAGPRRRSFRQRLHESRFAPRGHLTPTSTSRPAKRCLSGALRAESTSPAHRGRSGARSRRAPARGLATVPKRAVNEAAGVEHDHAAPGRQAGFEQRGELPGTETVRLGQHEDTSRLRRCVRGATRGAARRRSASSRCRSPPRTRQRLRDRARPPNTAVVSKPTGSPRARRVPQDDLPGSKRRARPFPGSRARAARAVRARRGLRGWCTRSPRRLWESNDPRRPGAHGRRDAKTLARRRRGPAATSASTSRSTSTTVAPARSEAHRDLTRSLRRQVPSRATTPSSPSSRAAPRPRRMPSR